MRTALSISLLAIFLIACGSASQDPPGVIPPQINIRHVGGIPPMRAGVSLPIYFEVDVLNQSSEPITLERAQIVSSGSGSYEIFSRTEHFRTEIAPGQIGTVSLPATVRVFSVRTSAMEPISVRAMVYFDSPLGKFRRVVIQQLSSGIGDPG